MAFASLKQLWFCERENRGTCSLSFPSSSPLLLLKPRFLKSYETWARAISKDCLIRCSPRGRILAFPARREKPAVSAQQAMLQL